MKQRLIGLAQIGLLYKQSSMKEETISWYGDVWAEIKLGHLWRLLRTVTERKGDELTWGNELETRGYLYVSRSVHRPSPKHINWARYLPLPNIPPHPHFYLTTITAILSLSIVLYYCICILCHCVCM